ncbi:hypothetical protein KPL26_03320 [Clostridium algidicarnis]|uniref:hypothetical protein n=1 Tax=Clostridium algidicarnis TaxID=37659 RepID=UPI001C0AF16B|nr:hypothetical protein [Clostridium algidicarnis]MBU3195693.1 hypothetical protein [Clostridium algidicarnis]
MFSVKDIENIKGYNKLNDKSKILFKAFLNNFYNAWGTETIESLVPISVEYVDNYVRFDYVRYGHKEWLHVKGARTWY